MTDTDLAPERICPAGFSLRSAKDPHAFHQRLREGDGSPVWDEGANGWLVYRFDQCAEAQKDEKRFGNLYLNADETTRAIKGGGANITLSRDKEHDRLRKLHLRLLSPANVERYRPRHISQVITDTLDRLGDRKTVDATTDIADRIPPRVICSLLGIPNTDDEAMQRLLDLNHEILMIIESGFKDPAKRDRALAASAELNEVLRPYVVRARDNPGDDFIGRVWQEAPDFGIDLDEEAALGLCRELYFGGSDTTMFGIANAIYTLLSTPAAIEAVKHGDRAKAITAVVEESLRLYGVVQYRQRFCVEDTTIGEARIRKGQAVYLLNAAANRDPEQYDCPATLDVTRKGPTNHLAFGRGTRSCIGSQVARVELREVLDQMLTRYPDMRLDPDSTPVFTGVLHRQVRPLLLRLRD